MPISQFLFQLLILPVLFTAAVPLPQSAIGNDISYPQCNKINRLPKPADFMILGVTGGRSFTENPCLGYEYLWAIRTGRTPALYINTNMAAGKSYIYSLLGPLACAQTVAICRQYNYGFQAAQFAYEYANRQGVKSTVWWLDVETANSWDDDPHTNTMVLQGFIDYFTNMQRKKKQGPLLVGIYTTPKQWHSLMGKAFVPQVPGQKTLPLWIVNIGTIEQSRLFCAPKSPIGFGKIAMIQTTAQNIDADVLCSS